MGIDVHFSSASDEWETPQELFDKLNTEFNFGLDPCASNENHKCRRYFTIETNGLKQEWSEHITSDQAVWVNPPYSGIAEWVAKCRHEADKGVAVVMLIPARTETRYWFDHIWGRAQIRFLKGRLKFNDHAFNAPFPSCVVVYRQGVDAAAMGWDWRNCNG